MPQLYSIDVIQGDLASSKSSHLRKFNVFSNLLKDLIIKIYRNLTYSQKVLKIPCTSFYSEG